MPDNPFQEFTPHKLGYPRNLFFLIYCQDIPQPQHPVTWMIQFEDHRSQVMLEVQRPFNLNKNNTQLQDYRGLALWASASTSSRWLTTWKTHFYLLLIECGRSSSVCSWCNNAASFVKLKLSYIRLSTTDLLVCISIAPHSLIERFRMKEEAISWKSTTWPGYLLQMSVSSSLEDIT